VVQEIASHLESQFFPIFEHAAVGFAKVGLQCEWLHVNHKLCEMTGYSERELLAMTFKDITHPDDLEGDLSNMRKVMAGDLNINIMEKRYIRKDGSIVWVHLNAMLVHDAQNEPDYFITIIEDITQRKQAELNLQKQLEREQLVAEILDSIRSETDLDTILEKTINRLGQLTQADRCAVWLFDAEKQEFEVPQHEYHGQENIAYIANTVSPSNPVLPFGLSPSEIVRFTDILQAEGLTDMDRKMIAERKIKSLLHVPILYQNQLLGVLRMHTTRENRVWNDEVVSLVKHIGSQVSIAIHQAQVLKQLRTSESRKSGILESSLDAIITIDAEGKVVEWNTAAERILGYSRKEVLDQYHMAELIIPESLRASHYQGIAHYLATGEGPILGKLLELPALRSDGTEIMVELTVTRVPNVNPLLFTGTLRDITARKLAESKLLSYTQRLAQSNQELEDFATIASHDLQAPLRKVIIFGDMLRSSTEGILSDECVDYINRIQKSSGRMQDLITDLLALSRITRKANPFEPTNLNAIVAEVLEMLDINIQESKAQITVGDLCTVEADASQMKQVFTNLIGNSLKFTQPGVRPKISIQSIRNGQQYDIRIQDNGIGFDTEFNELIFKVFERLHGVTYPGTGIGLTIVKKIMERHHGTVSASGKPKQGATFILSLPVKQPSA